MPSERDQSWIQPRPSAKTLLQTIEDALRDPNPFASAEQFRRLHHDDVPSLSLDEMDDERLRLRVARAFHLISEWGLERLMVLDRESSHRRQVRR